MTGRDLDGLLAEAEAAPIRGWDFSWLDGRATEERPAWGYSSMATGRVRCGACAVLDIQTGGGEVFEGILAAAGRTPEHLAATESWAPNVDAARARLGPLGATVAVADDGGALPFPDASFDLVLSRHPTRWSWPEITRVLLPGGTYLAQLIGPGTNRELTEFFLGPQVVSDARSAARARAEAGAAGLSVVDVREQSLRVEFFDVGAVVYFLRLVIWTVPNFSVARYRGRLVALQRQIDEDGTFVCHAQRLLFEAVRPERAGGGGLLEKRRSSPPRSHSGRRG
jgi:SAM-dependent methyltransferase